MRSDNENEREDTSLCVSDEDKWTNPSNHFLEVDTLLADKMTFV